MPKPSPIALRRADIGLTVVSPLSALLPRFKADAVAGNEEAAAALERTPELAAMGGDQPSPAGKLSAGGADAVASSVRRHQDSS